MWVTINIQAKLVLLGRYGCRRTRKNSALLSKLLSNLAMAKEQIHVVPKEDIELAKKADELKKEEIEAKSKEQRWL
ncbi:hypothetical protein Tco_1351147 [Tanacetum coccineum]